MSAELFERLSGLDRLVHEPARLAILTALSVCRRADFMYLLRLTGLTRGNLSTHLSKLEQGGLVRIEKRFVGRKPNTLVALSPRGRRTVEDHWRQLEELRRGSRQWNPSEDAGESDQPQAKGDEDG